MSSMDNDLELAHGHSSMHRVEVLGSSICGGIYCMVIFPPSDVVEWVDEDPSGQGQPLCVRSVGSTA